MKKSIYEELADTLLERIVSGAFSEGKLPSMSSLAEEYKVNLQTANRAVKVLEQKGVVKCHAGKGGTRIDPARAHLVGTSSGNHFSVDQALSSTQRVRLRFLFDVSLLREPLEKAATLFTKRYPWVEIELIPAVQVHQSIADGVAFDCLMLIGRDVAQYARKQFLFDLTDILSAEGWNRDGFIPHVWDQNVYKDRFYSIPFSWTLPVLLFNKTEVSAPATWRDYSKTLLRQRKLNGKESRLRIGFYSLLQTIAGDIENDRTRAVNRTAFRELLHSLKHLCVNLPKGHYLWNNPKDLDNFDLEKNCMICVNFSGMEAFLKTPHPDWETAPFPREENGRNVLATETLAIARNSATPAEAWLWCKFLLRDEVRRLFEISSCLSPKISSFRNCALPSSVKQFLENEAENAVAPALSSRGMFNLYSSIFPLLESYFSNLAGEDETIDRILEFLNEQLILDSQF